MNFGEILEIEESQKKEIKKLREENKKLKQELEGVYNLNKEIYFLASLVQNPRGKIIARRMKNEQRND